MEAGIAMQQRSLRLLSGYFSKILLSSEVANYKEFKSSDVDYVISILRREATNLHVPFKEHVTQFVVEAISLMMQEGSSREGLSNGFLLAIVTRLSNDRDILLNEVQQKLHSHVTLVPARLLMELDQHGAMSLVYYFQGCADSKEKSTCWIRSLVSLACESADEKNHITFVYLFTAMVEIGFGTMFADVSSGGQMQKTALQIINSVIRKIWDFLWENPEKEFQLLEISAISSQKTTYFQLSSFQKCYLDQLQFLISYKPEIKASKAVNSQSEWTFFKSPRNIASFVSQLLIPLEADKVLERIEDILNRYEINWKTLLLVVSAIQVCYDSGNRRLKALVAGLLQKAIEKPQTDLLLAAFLVARQMNAESTSGVHYGLWFSSVTSSSTTSKQFSFLMKFLSSMVRHEPGWVLIAHKNNPPFIPLADNCRGLWADYIALLRTRIDDFKAKAIADHVVGEDLESQNEVESAIAAYEKTGRIPNSVIEASIFSKPYYNNKFLPALLKPRRIPNPRDVREDFIDSLRQSQKLPLPLYEAYALACKQLETSAPAEEWHFSDDAPNDHAHIFKQAALCQEQSQRSAFLNKASSMLQKLVVPLDVTAIDVNQELLDGDLEADSKQVISGWIGSFEMCLALGAQMDWFNALFHLLCPHPSLLRALYSDVWQFVSKCSGSEEAIKCYGWILFLVSRHRQLLVPVRQGTSTRDFVDWLNDQLNPRRAEVMLFLMRLLYETLNAAKSSESTDMHSLTKMAQMYQWLARRVSYSQKVEPPCQLLQTDIPAMSLEEWLKLEIQVEADEDVLQWTERLSYFHAALDADYYNESNNVPRLVLDSIVRRALTIDRIKSCKRLDCSQSLLQLLQSRLSVSHGATQSSREPWLLHYWIQSRQEHGNNLDTLLWNLVCSLPAYLLIRNCEKESTEKGSVKMLVGLIEDGWRNTITDGSWLPKHITLHLVRALEGSKEFVPLLQFSQQIHDNAKRSSSPSASWKMLNDALSIFHPRRWNRETQVRWSGQPELDLLVSHLMILAAAINFSETCNQDWPWFVNELGIHVTQNPALLSACKMTYWVEDPSGLPWRKILPDYLSHLLPLILVHILLSWSEGLLRRDLQTAVDYLETLLLAHSNWIQTTNIFIDSLTISGSKADYPAGKLLDLPALGRLSRDIQRILSIAPLRAVNALVQLPSFQLMDADFQMAITQRLK